MYRICDTLRIAKRRRFFEWGKISLIKIVAAVHCTCSHIQYTDNRPKSCHAHHATLTKALLMSKANVRKLAKLYVADRSRFGRDLRKALRGSMEAIEATKVLDKGGKKEESIGS